MAKPSREPGRRRGWWPRAVLGLPLALASATPGDRPQPGGDEVYQREVLPVLEAYCETHDEPDMHQALVWSKAVNDTVADIVQGGLPPFPHVRECLEKAHPHADMIVCSQTPTEALTREWQEQGIAEFVFAIAGQEMGKKSEHIAYTSSDGRYEKSKMLMIGDAPGDMKAARANDAMFFPILPGEEDKSWKRLYDEGLDRIFAGEYVGDYETALVEEFEKCLPETPPWKN